MPGTFLDRNIFEIYIRIMRNRISEKGKQEVYDKVSNPNNRKEKVWKKYLDMGGYVPNKEKKISVIKTRIK